jgi:N6-L-threonylcarbamoyladenine synthase
MLVLGLETSCDETAVALVRDGQEIVADLISSQTEIHRPYGGVVPELASRQHLENLFPLLDECLEKGEVGWEDIDGIAVTRGPGLIGALLVGVSAAKTLAWARGLPLVGVHHIEAHLHSLTLDHDVTRPCLAFVVSGGHTELYLAPETGGWQMLARTRDDAAGEAYDKVGKILGLGYPAGPLIDRLASDYEGPREPFPVAKMSDGSPDLSFSGLKTTALRLVQAGRVSPWSHDRPPKSSGDVGEEFLSVLAGFQEAVAEQILDRVRLALEDHPDTTGFGLSGGVSANQYLRTRAARFCEERGIPLWVPPLRLSTDNAVMIAALGHEKLKEGVRDDLAMPALADLSIEDMAQ